MKKDDEKWAIFWCDLFRPIIFDEIEPEGVHQYLKNLSQKEVVFPDGRCGKASLSRLKRKLKKYQQGGFAGLTANSAGILAGPGLPHPISSKKPLS